MPLNYSPYYNPYLNPYQPQQITQPPTGNTLQAQSAVNNGIIWVQGEAGAKSYLVGAGNSVLLMDSEQSRFYIKATDASGMPMPLRIFEYSEVSTGNAPASPSNAKTDNDYVTHEELERRLKELETRPKTTKKGSEKDAEPTV